MMLATSSEHLNEMQRLLARELELNGIKIENNHKWLSSKTILNELSIVIASEAHEGLIPSIGVLFVEVAAELYGVDYVLVSVEHIEMARKFANGIDCFLIYEKDIFFGLVYFKEPISNELLLVRAFPPSGGLFVQRGPGGIIKFFQGNNIILLENRSWYRKPLIKEAAWKISRCVSEINHNVLNTVLEFAFHLLSPIPKVGATIVWWLNEITIDNVEILTTGIEMNDFRFSLLDEKKANSFCHFFSLIDGATYVNSEGDILRTGIHLKNSNKSRTIIPELKGTRHTSAKRFSYDFTNTLVITISSDGPVTIFSDGVNIAGLSIHPSYKSAHDLRKILPEKQLDITSSTYELICHFCEKNLVVEQVNVFEWDKDLILNCPICQGILKTENCFTLESRPYKHLVKTNEVLI